MFDILILNGQLVDGTGNPRRLADLAIQNGTIVEIGNLKNRKAKKRIDARGMVVTPGLIDVHSHTDVTVKENPYFHSTIMQGITTEVVGNCGNSVVPASSKSTGGFGKFSKEPVNRDISVAQYMQELEEAGMSANIAWLVGHNTIRTIAGIEGKEFTDEQFDAMESLLRQSMEDGALGMSSGLEFDPGRLSAPDELLRLTKVLVDYDGIYTSHIRNRDAKVLDALAEFLNVLRSNGLRGEVSHMNIRHNTHAPQGAIQTCMEMIQSARNDGVEVLTDMTPLNYGIGSMAGILPTWLTASPKSELRTMLLDPEIRGRLRNDCDRYWRFITNGEWDRVRMQSNLAIPSINGMTFPEISRLWNKDPWDCYFDILAENAPDIGSVVLVSYLFTDEHLKETISNPLYMLVVDGYSTTCDGDLAKFTGFPLHYIGMAWFLTHHVREKHTLSLEEAIRKMTSMPAQHFRLGKRGLLIEGYIADVCAFDFEKLATPFDLQNPCQYTEGMSYVIVNGTLVLDEGVHTYATPGQCIRRAM